MIDDLVRRSSILEVGEVWRWMKRLMHIFMKRLTAVGPSVHSWKMDCEHLYFVKLINVHNN